MRMQILQTLCDRCGADDNPDRRAVEARPWTFSTLPPGARKPRSVDVDLCEACGQELADALAVFERVGRPSGKATGPTSLTGTHAEAAEDGAVYACPVEGCQYTTPKTARAHVWRARVSAHSRQQHGMSLAVVLGEGTEYTCTVCGAKFGSNSGARLHERRAHGVPGSRRSSRAPAPEPELTLTGT